MTRTAIGIDIGGTHLRAARVSEAGEVLASATADSAGEADAVMARCVGLVEQVRAPDVSGIGIGVPGQVLADTRRVLSGGYVDLSGIDFADLMEQRTGLPVTIENDAAMALLGEAAHGAARGLGNVVMLTIGTGIGGAVLERGRLLRGRGTAGQLGHLTVVQGGRQCVCGRRGCVETESSGTAFGVHLAEAGLPPGTRAEELLARSGDPLADAVLTAWATPLRAAIDTLIATCAPDLVVLGGGAGSAAAAALRRVPAPASWFDAPVVAAGLGSDAGIIGAAMAALPRRKRAVLVNGVPASGKSQVARALSAATGWHVLALDTVKTPFLAELAPVDRLQNRTLGRASYAALFGLIADMPPGSTVIIDAWFGFQPPDLLETHLARSGVSDTLEIWCAAPPETVGARYAARAGTRPSGHPGPEYVPELIALAGRAVPNGRGPVLTVDTTAPADTAEIAEWIAGQWQNCPPFD